MGYRATGSLEAFGAIEPMHETQRRTVERVGDLLLERTRHHTPIAKPPPGVAAEWLAARKRAPGTLRESWRVGEVTVSAGGTVMRIPVETFDPVAPHVEWPTLPHPIPLRPGGVLRFWDRFGRTVYATIVQHTGTKGSYMLTTALGELAIMWQDIGREELRRWAQEQARVVMRG